MGQTGVKRSADDVPKPSDGAPHQGPASKAMPVVDWRGDYEAQTASSCATLRVEQANGRSAATRVYGTYPTKLMVPDKLATPGSDCVWAYGVTFGGGLVSGDLAGMSVSVEPGCACVLATQANTKVYKQRPSYGGSSGPVKGGAAVQAIGAAIGSGGLLAILPDPVVCFRDSNLRQVIQLDLAADASVVVVDWLTAGRTAYGEGERWAFERYRSRMNLQIGGEQALTEATQLQGSPAMSLEEQMGAVHVVGTILLCGPRASSAIEHATAMVKDIATRAMQPRTLGASWVHQKPSLSLSRGTAPSSGLLASASPFALPKLRQDSPAEEGLIVRFAGDSVDRLYEFLRDVLKPLEPQIGAAPYWERGDA